MATLNGLTYTDFNSKASINSTLILAKLNVIYNKSFPIDFIRGKVYSANIELSFNNKSEVQSGKEFISKVHVNKLLIKNKSSIKGNYHTAVVLNNLTYPFIKEVVKMRLRDLKKILNILPNYIPSNKYKNIFLELVALIFGELDTEVAIYSVEEECYIFKGKERTLVIPGGKLISTLDDYLKYTEEFILQYFGVESFDDLIIDESEQGFLIKKAEIVDKDKFRETILDLQFKGIIKKEKVFK